ACRDGKQRSKVLGVLEMMMEDGIPPSGRSYSFALQACAKDGNVVDAKKMLNSMWTSPDLEGGVPGLRPTTWGYNCAMEACARSGNCESASEIMREMRDHGLDHDAFTYGAALEACGRLGNWGQAELVVGQMAEAYAESIHAHGGGSGGSGAGRSTLTPTTVHCNALLNAYCRGERLADALCLLDRMLTGAGAPSAAQWETARNDPETVPDGSVAQWEMTINDPGIVPDGPVAQRETVRNNQGIVPDDSVAHWETAAARSDPETVPDGSVAQWGTVKNDSGTGSDDLSAPPPRVSPARKRARFDPSSAGAATDATGEEGGDVEESSPGGKNTPPVELWDVRLPLPRADAVSFGTVIDGCSRARDSDAAVKLLAYMRREGVGGGEGDATVAVVAFDVGGGGGGDGGSRGGSGGGVPNESHATPPLSPPPPPPPNAYCVTAAIMACGRARKPAQAVALLHEAVAAEEIWLDRSRVGRAGTVAVAATRRAGGGARAGGEGGEGVEGGSGGGGREKVGREEAEGGRGGVRIGGGGGGREERQVFGRAGREGVGALVPAYNAAIDACVRAGQHEEARELVEGMRGRGMTPGREVFNSLLGACSDSSEVSREAFSG
ncbi:unnamed protein product, partial [Laminaria digitata]